MSADGIWSAAKRVVDDAGIGYPLRQAFVHVRSLGEYLLHALEGRPDPQSTILVAGSGRSGTTWLGEMLCHDSRIQEIFEPLLPFWNDEVRELTGWRTEGAWLQGVYLRADAERPAWCRHLHKVFTGRVRNHWTDARRTAWFPTRYLVKSIRMNLMLGFVARQLNPQIVFIIRNPVDVVASRINVGWQADLGDILKQQALVEDHLGPWEDALRAVSDPVEQHAAWWAVENLVALRELQGCPHHVVVYEQLSEAAVGVVGALREQLGVEGAIDATTAARPSRMAGSRGTSDRRSSLSAEDIQKINEWCYRRGLLELYPTAVQRWSVVQHE